MIDKCKEIQGLFNEINEETDGTVLSISISKIRETLDCHIYSPKKFIEIAKENKNQYTLINHYVSEFHKIDTLLNKLNFYILVNTEERDFIVNQLK